MSIDVGPSVSRDGLLLELDPANINSYDYRENLLLTSGQFSNTNWSAIGAITATANATIAPDGTLTANKLVVGSGTALNATALGQQPNKPAATATPYTFSVHVKAGEWNTIRVYMRENGNTSNSADLAFNAATGAYQYGASAVGTFTNASGSFQSIGNGWYRVSLTATTSTEVAIRAQVYSYDSVATTGDGTSGIYVWGAQLERGSAATPYTPTTSAAVTRGTVWTDLSGNGNHATLASTDVYTNNNNGRLTQTGSTHYAYVPYTASLAPSTAVSFGGWCYSPSWVGITDTRLISKTETGGYQIAFNTSGSNMLVYVNGGYTTAAFNYPFTAASAGWHHFFCTSDRTSVKAYCDGVLITNQAVSSPGPLQYTNNNNLVVGAEAGAGASNSIVAGNFLGSIGYVSVYGRALSDNEVKLLFNAHRGRYGI